MHTAIKPIEKGTEIMTKDQKAKLALRDQVRTILARNTTIKSEDTNMLRGEKGRIIGSEVVFTVEGDGVKSPFRRNYLKKKLAKLGEGATSVGVRKTVRKSGETVIAITTMSATSQEAPPVLEAAEIVETPVDVEAVSEAEVSEDA
jgi:hypothetical protein